MAIKTILVAVSGGAASAGAIATAFGLARRLGAHVEAFHARIDERQALVNFGDGMGAAIPADLIERIAKEAKETAATARRIFDAAVAEYGFPLHNAPPRPAKDDKGGLAASADWREETGYAADLIATRARVCDLVVLGRSDRVADQPHTDSVEAAVLDSGRPVLIAPATPGTALGRRIAIGWNDTVEAVHAMAAALPLLRDADDVRVITIGDEDEGLGAPAVEHLAWHGIAASARFVKTVSGVSAGAQLLSTAHEVGADLLVMGAYGHAPWREMLFGGATRDVVGTSLLPLLLAH